MDKNNLAGYSGARKVIDAVAAAQSDPDGTTPVFTASNSNKITTLLSYSGASTGTLQLWVKDDTTWYKGEPYAFNSTAGNIALEWSIRPLTFTFTLLAKSGAGTITVKAI